MKPPFKHAQHCATFHAPWVRALASKVMPWECGHPTVEYKFGSVGPVLCATCGMNLGKYVIDDNNRGVYTPGNR